MNIQIGIILCVLVYFAALYIIARITSKNATNASYFVGNKSSKWWVVAYGMVGTSLSGVTFMSVPGKVGAGHFTYFELVLGFFVGYMVVAFVLLPLYYRMNLSSIYGYLKERLGIKSYRTGAGFFILSRTMGATLRTYLVINTLQFFLAPAGLFYYILISVVIMAMILLYTYEGGVKSIVWTDLLQTSFMLLALVVVVFYIMNDLGLSFGSMYAELTKNNYNEIFIFDVLKGNYFLKALIGGAFITITMTGMDQEMMQKNISCKNIGEAQKNMVTFSFILVAVNFIFLILGGLLYLYATHYSIQVPALSDELFPMIAMNYLPGIISIIFMIGLISALFPSADGALTALTSSFCIDILGIQENKNLDEKAAIKLRQKVHLGFTLLFLVLVILFKILNHQALIDILFEVAGYTYGPLLGLFMFGILTRRSVMDRWVPLVCFISPVLCYILNIFVNRPAWVANWQGLNDLLPVLAKNHYVIGTEMILINGLITFAGLLLISKKAISK